MNTDVKELRLLCVQGFCKIIFNSILEDASILALLILEFCNPQSLQFEAAHDCLASFFPAFARNKRENSHFLLDALVVAIKAILKDRKTRTAVIGLINVGEMVVYFCGLTNETNPNGEKLRDSKQSFFGLELLQLLYASREVCAFIELFTYFLSCFSLSLCDLISSAARNLRLY
jgi:hypothetical protein